MEEDNHLLLSSEEDSSTPDECELGLDLSLGFSGGDSGCLRLKSKVPRIRPKILMAEDLNSMISASSPSPSSSSSSSSTSSRANDPGGTKRATDSISATNAASSQVVGWPPIRSYRMNNLVNKTPLNKEFDHSVIEKRNGSDAKKSSNDRQRAICLKPFLVKVNMDGAPIGRKVDLNAHNCYETLAHKLQDMFSSTPSNYLSAARGASNLLDGSSGFVLTYEDKEGDWMLVGDVPWSMFLNSGKRLRIMRSAKANGIIT